MALNTVAKAAPSWAVPRADRFQPPSASVYCRQRRCWWMRRLVASESGSAAALIRAHSSRSSASDVRAASSSSRFSADRSASAALVMAAACAEDSSPLRSAPATLGSSVTLFDVSSASLAAAVEVPAFRASDSAAVRVPARSRSWVAATLRASSVLPAEPSRSMRSNSPHRSRAVGPLTASGSNAQTSSLSRSRTRTTDSYMRSTLLEGSDTVRVVTPGLWTMARTSATCTQFLNVRSRPCSLGSGLVGP